MGDRRLHYSGGLLIRGRGVTEFLAGWPVCCSGERCLRIARDGRQTAEIDRVTCRACLRQIERAVTSGGQIVTGCYGAVRL